MLQGPNTDQAVLKRLNNDASGGRLFHGQAVNYRKDGSEFMKEWKIVPILNEMDQITRYRANQRDIGESSF